MAIDIRFEMRPPLGALAQYRNLFARLTEARSLAVSIGDRRREAVIGADMTHVLYHLGDVEQALEVGEQAARAARDVGDPRVLVQAVSNNALARVCKGEFRSAVEIAEPFARELKSTFRHERLGTTGTSACIWLGNLCGSNALVGDFSRAIDHGEEACRIARETGLPFDRAMSSTWLAFGLMLKGETERSIPLVEEGLQLVRENELEFLFPWSLMVWVGSHAIAHDSDRALSVLEEAAVQRERLPSLVLLWVWFGAAEAMAVCESGQYERAAALCAEQLTTIARHELRTFEAPVRRTLGLCIARGAGDAGDIEAARAALTRARGVATSQGALPEVAHANLALAELSAEQGDLADARALAGSALAAYTRMGMTRWRADAEAILASS